MSRVADTLRAAPHDVARSDLVHAVCPDCSAREPVPLLALCGQDLSDDVRDEVSPLSCDQCARIVAAAHAGATILCPGCSSWWDHR